MHNRYASMYHFHCLFSLGPNKRGSRGARGGWVLAGGSPENLYNGVFKNHPFPPKMLHNEEVTADALELSHSVAFWAWERSSQIRHSTIPTLSIAEP